MQNFVPQFIIQKYAQGERNGRFKATTLFIDFAGFSSLTESMFRFGQSGAEQLSQTIKSNLKPVIQTVQQAGGIIPLFAGDAFIAIFPSTSESNEDEQNAWATAAQMISTWESSAENAQTLGIKIGMGKGEVEWGIVGEDGCNSYYFRGDAIEQCAHAQTYAQPGQLILAAELLPSPFQPITRPIGSTGFFNATGLPDVSLISSQNNISAYSINETRNWVSIPESIHTIQGDAEFRTIAPVFISFKDFDHHDDLNAFVSVIINLTNQYGGTFSQLDFGDKGGVIVLWFGAPISYENNAERAISCLVALREHSQFKAKWRAGVTHGMVWAGIRGASTRKEYGAIGNVVNTAARLAFKANWGDIWVHENVADQIHHVQDLEHIGQFMLKGLSHETAVYRVTHQFKQPNTAPTGAFIGRNSELTFLTEAIQPLFKGEFSGVIYLDGEAGIGKSHLMAEWLSQNKEQLNWLYCPTNDILKQSLNPIKAGLNQYFSTAPYVSIQENQSRIHSKISNLQQALQETESSTLQHLLKSIPRIERHLQTLLEIQENDGLQSQLDPKLQYQNILTSISSFIKLLSASKPLILLIEDAHWLDQDTKSYLDSLPNLLFDFPVAIVIVSRYLAQDNYFQLDLPEHIPTSRLSLSHLSSSHSESLIKSLADSTVLPNTLQYLQDKSNGNPLFLKQLTLLINEKSGQPAPSMIESSTSFQYQVNPLLPETINDLLVSRLDQLEPQTKQLVQIASVLGQKVSSKVLRALTKANQQEFERCRETAVRQNIWLDTSKSECHFAHALMRDAAYMMLMQSQKRDLHLQAAQTVEEIYARDLKNHYDEIAHHFENAFHLGEESILYKALDYLQCAAAEARAKYENWSAIEHLERAVSIAPNENLNLQFSLKIELVKTYAKLGERYKQAAYLKELECEFEKLLPEQKVEYLVFQASYYYFISEYKKVLPITSKGIEIAKEYNLELGKGRLILQKGSAIQRLDDFEEAKNHFHKAQKIALRLEEAEFLASVYWAIGSLYYQNNQLDLSENFFKQNLNIFQDLNHLSGKAKSLNALGAVKATQGNLQDAKKYFQECQQIAQEIGERYLNGILKGNLGRLAADFNEHAKAENLYLESIDLQKEVGNFHGAIITYNNLSDLLIQLGRYRQAEKYCRTGLKYTEQISFTDNELIFWGRIGELEIINGEYEKAEKSIIHSYSLAQESDNQTRQFFAHSRLGICNFFLSEYSIAKKHLNIALSLSDKIKTGLDGRIFETHLYLTAVYQKLREHHEANKNLIQVFEQFETKTLEMNTLHPFNIYLLLYQILVNFDDPRSEEILNSGYTHLKTICNNLPTVDDKQDFLKVPVHQKLIQAWESNFLDKAPISVNNSYRGEAQRSSL